MNGRDLDFSAIMTMFEERLATFTPVKAVADAKKARARTEYIIFTIKSTTLYYLLISSKTG